MFPTERPEQYAASGIEYFVAARHSAHCGHRVAGVLFHHAFEMVLSAALAKEGATNETLQAFRHDLRKYWAEFRRLFAARELVRWTQVVGQLQNWEDIRFPTGDFYPVMIGVTGSAETSIGIVGEKSRRVVTHHQVRLWELDEFFQVVVLQMRLDRDWVRDAMGVWDDGVKTYERDNSHAI
jgi:hypothetical protein